MPFIGEVLPLSLQLLDGATDKFVRVTLFEKPSGNTFGTFNIPHIGLGKYSLNTVLMPAGVDYLDATYDVFNDALFTIPSPDHLQGTEVFPLEVPDSVILAKLDEIIGKIASVSSVDVLHCVIKAKDLIKGTITSDRLAGVLQLDKVIGRLSAGGLVGIAGQQKLTAVIRDC